MSGQNFIFDIRRRRMTFEYWNFLVAL
jgi:hypothetical protein